MRKVLVLLPFVFSCAMQTKDAHLYSASKNEITKKADLPSSPAVDVESLYVKEQIHKLTKLLREEPTPLAVPPTVLRVFVLPYTTESGELITQHYFYLKVDEGRWIMGDYLLKKGEPIKELKPLE